MSLLLHTKIYIKDETSRCNHVYNPLSLFMIERVIEYLFIHMM